MIRSYLGDMINDHKAPIKLRVNSGNKIIDHETQFGEQKIQLTMQINFISSKDSEEIRTMSTKSDNIEIMKGSETSDVIKELRESLLQRYQEGLEKKNQRKRLFCNSIDLLYYHFRKASLRRGRSFEDSPEWLKNKTATINPKNKKDDNCFQYALTVALNHQNIERDHQRISQIKPFISE